MAFRVVCDIFVIVHADMPPSAEDWSEMSRLRDACAVRLKGQLVVGPPRAIIDARQRADVKMFWQRSHVSLAILTDSRLVRGAAIAVAWFGVTVRAWPPECIDEAMAFLVVPVERRDEVRQAAMALAAEVRGSSPRV